jgi:mRNA interferase YafQ
MLPIRPTSRFQKDLKKAKAQGNELEQVKKALVILSIPKLLPSSFKNHKLKRCVEGF